MSSIKGHLPSKLVLHQRLSFIKGHLQWKLLFYQRVPSIKGLPKISGLEKKFIQKNFWSKNFGVEFWQWQTFRSEHYFLLSSCKGSIFASDFYKSWYCTSIHDLHIPPPTIREGGGGCFLDFSTILFIPTQTM